MADQRALDTPPLPLVLELQARAAKPAFYVGSGDMTAGPYARSANIFTHWSFP